MMPKIEQLKMLSIFIVYELSRRKDFKIVDLHYLMIDEAEQVLFLIFDEIRNYKDSSKFRITIVVGKGNHSANGPVLLPHFQRSLPKSGYKIINVEEGRIVCQI